LALPAIKVFLQSFIALGAQQRNNVQVCDARPNASQRDSFWRGFIRADKNAD